MLSKVMITPVIVALKPKPKVLTVRRVSNSGLPAWRKMGM
jgi:hypothetical protein